MKLKNKTIIKTLLTLLIFIFLTINCFAFGVSPVKTNVDFVSDSGVYTGTLKIVNTNQEHLTLSLSSSGVLENNIEFEDNIVTIQSYEQEKIVSFKIIIDESVAVISRGVIVVSEIKESLGVGSAVSLTHEVVVRKYAEDYVDFSFGVSQSEEKITFLANLENVGAKDVEDLSMEFSVGDKTGFLENIYVSSGDSKGVSTSIPRKKIVDGEYIVSAKISYGKNHYTKTKKVWIGSPSVSLISIPSELYSGMINKFVFNLQNNWNSDLDTVFIEFNLFNDQKKVSSFRTKSFVLSAGDFSTITDYFDASNLDPGKYSVKTLISINGNALKGQDFELELVRPGIFSSENSNNTLLIVLAMVVILLLCIIGWIVIKKYENVRK